MPRPRTVTDQQILQATGRAIGRLGPHRLTLADVAEEVGLAPATLVQRFGSKRGLLLALAEGGVGAAGEEFRAAHTDYDSPLVGLVEVLVGCSGFAKTPEEMSNHLAFLQIDLDDPDFHRFALAHSEAVRAEIRALLDKALEVGDLRPCDTGRLARAVQVTFNGSLITWAIHREGHVDEATRFDLETLLRPFRTGTNGPGGE